MKENIPEIQIDEIIAFAAMLDEKRFTDFIRKELKAKDSFTGETIVHLACKHPHKLAGTFKLLNKYQIEREISEILEETDYFGNTFLQGRCIKKPIHQLGQVKGIYLF